MVMSSPKPMHLLLIPSLNATDFLERLRGKRLVFVGDSLNRNMWESLVCILRHSVRHKKKVYEISGKREFKKKGIYAFRFEVSLHALFLKFCTKIILLISHCPFIAALVGVQLFCGFCGCSVPC